MLRRRALLAAGAATLGGCSRDAAVNHSGENAPAAVPPPATPRRVAWVFSSGGPRGVVHVGVVKALVQLGCRPDLVVGASAGALLGTLVAAGMPAAQIEQLALDLQPWQMLRLNVAGGERFSGAPLADWVNEQVGSRPLQALPVPMACAVQRLRDRSALAFNQGDSGLAVQASTAIEGTLAPVTIRGERYADADQCAPLPVRLARALGATRVLAVDASAHEDRAPPGAERYREADLRKRALTRPDAEAADVLLHPDFGYWVNMSRTWREGVIAAGERAALAQAEALRQLHNQHT